jgi:hypothetical protein
MGVGAIIGAVGSVAAAGIGAASKGGLFGGGGGGSSMPKPKPVKLQGVTLPDYMSSLSDYAGQSSIIPSMAETASMADNLSNKAYQQALGRIYPGLSSQISQISNLAGSYLSGIIPQDVQDQIQRATAQQAISGGYGATSGMGRNLTARDLGLASTSLQEMGTKMFGIGANAARALNPSFTPVSSLLMTPAQLLARQDQAAYYNTDVKNQQEIINSGNQMALQGYKAAQGGSAMSGLGGGISSITSALSKLFGSGGLKFGGGGGGAATGGAGGDIGIPDDYTGYLSDYDTSGGAGSSSADWGMPDDWTGDFGSYGTTFNVAEASRM